MKFFFAENFDRVDPCYDFIKDCSEPGRNRQGEDVFCHELFPEPPYDGVLVSRSTIESKKSRCTQPERFRIKREGIRNFLRFPRAKFKGDPQEYPIIGDCGSYSSLNKQGATFGVEDTFNFYVDGKFDYGISPDIIVTETCSDWDDARKRPSDIESRVEQTYCQGKAFLSLCKDRQPAFIPIGAIQFWSIKSAGRYAKKFTDLGYQYIGVGGIAHRPTQEIFNIVGEIRERIPAAVKLHLFGFTRTKEIHRFFGFGITSIDSTSPLIKAFKDDRQNLFMQDGQSYMALRVPKLDRLPQSFFDRQKTIDISVAERLESATLTRLREFDSGLCTAEKAVESVLEYQRYLVPGSGNRQEYLRTLTDRPWRRSSSPMLKSMGIDSVLLRGLNRDKRRGFHNLFVFHQKIKKMRTMKTLNVPCIKIRQNLKKDIFTFVVNGKDIPKFAGVSRISRDTSGELLGYQRPEVLSHIKDIQNYLNKDDSLLPNSIVIAFKEPLKFNKQHSHSEDTQSGTLEIPIDRQCKSGWIVDGQQRVAALRQINRASYPVSVVAIDSASPTEEREQFVLVNNVKPLPRNLIYELLPVLGNSVPPKLRRRQHAYRLLEKLNTDPGSPFFERIRTATSGGKEEANIRDVSVLKMIENSINNGSLYKFDARETEACQLLNNFWEAISDVFANAWGLPPKDSRLTHGVGVVSCGFLMDAMAFKFSDRWKVPPKRVFAKELRVRFKNLPWTEGVWRFGAEVILPWNGLQNTPKHIDLLANHLIRRFKVSGVNK